MFSHNFVSVSMFFALVSIVTAAPVALGSQPSRPATRPATATTAAAAIAPTTGTSSTTQVTVPAAPTLEQRVKALEGHAVGVDKKLSALDSTDQAIAHVLSLTRAQLTTVATVVKEQGDQISLLLEGQELTAQKAVKLEKALATLRTDHTTTTERLLKNDKFLGDFFSQLANKVSTIGVRVDGHDKAIASLNEGDKGIISVLNEIKTEISKSPPEECEEKAPCPPKRGKKRSSKHTSAPKRVVEQTEDVSRGYTREIEIVRERDSTPAARPDSNVTQNVTIEQGAAAQAGTGYFAQPPAGYAEPMPVPAPCPAPDLGGGGGGFDPLLLLEMVRGAREGRGFERGAGSRHRGDFRRERDHSRRRDDRRSPRELRRPNQPPARRHIERRSGGRRSGGFRRTQQRPGGHFVPRNFRRPAPRVSSGRPARSRGPAPGARRSSGRGGRSRGR